MLGLTVVRYNVICECLPCIHCSLKLSVGRLNLLHNIKCWKWTR